MRHGFPAREEQFRDAASAATGLSDLGPPVDHDATTPDRFHGAFARFVDSGAVRDVAAFRDDYVERRSDRGSPHPLIDRFTGEPAKIDLGMRHAALAREEPRAIAYYPSSAVHQDAAAALLSAAARSREKRG